MRRMLRRLGCWLLGSGHIYKFRQFRDRRDPHLWLVEQRCERCDALKCPGVVLDYFGSEDTTPTHRLRRAH